jgi:hypothetical protein
MKVENKTIIITDPCYIVDNDKDWELSDYGEDMTGLKDITNCETSNTIYGDWSCTVYKGTLDEEPIEQNKLGNFCADAGMVGVFELEEVLKYNPNFDYHITKPWTTTVIENFTGEITIEEIDDEIFVIGNGNINFYSIQTGA